MATNQQNRDSRDQGKQGNTQGGSQGGNQGSASNSTSYQRDSNTNGGRMISEGSSNRDEASSNGDEF